MLETEVDSLEAIELEGHMTGDVQETVTLADLAPDVDDVDLEKIVVRVDGNPVLEIEEGGADG